ncbi:hypothetical protein CANMA_001215 [Candida margitis]|uniref:uncharacterized protein n=1 Tax=Candida margitis TaxID=1775924 RepID=UPI002226FDC0|nr:uncharacterized protein CANMA_001215 [Candida margitis]KAI5969753.1 hypothetical protein CANMA_001215 [Candida margitis]
MSGEVSLVSTENKHINCDPSSRLVNEKDGEVSVVHTGEFPLKSDPHSKIAWCPKMNLLLLTRDKHTIHCFRIRGEEIYNVNNGSEIKGITCHEKNFCLSGADNTVKIYDSSDGKLVRQLDHGFSDIMYIHWSKTVYSLKNEVLTSLPTIYDDISYNLDYLVTNDEKSITFTFNKVLSINIVTNHQISSQVSSALFEQQYFDRGDNRLICIEIPTISRKAYTDSMVLLCHIFEYLERSKTTLNEIEKEVKTFYVAINRYLSNLKVEVSGGDLLQDLCDILLTNNIPDGTKDFWVNQFGDRGFKKMNKLCETVFENCRKKIFQYLIAPMERILVLLDELNGIAKWKNAFELDLKDINRLIGKCKAELKTYHQFMLNIKEEKGHFDELLNWWKMIVDKFAEKETSSNYSTSSLLEFIHSNLLQSKVLQYIPSDFDSIKHAGDGKFLNESQEELEELFRVILGQVDEYHQSTVDISIATEICHTTPPSQMLGSVWSQQVVEAHSNYWDKTLEVSKLNDKVIDRVPDSKSFEFREWDLVVLTKDSLYILDHVSTTPIPLPELSFQPANLAANSKYVWITDKENVRYAVLKLK